ncbi:MAG TPA: hypothetical protein VK420_08695 [Longimicrobium sp.]|nr:hypothetical protein [Longimicrobium sp.]
MQKLESLDSSLFQVLDDQESLALVGGNEDALIDDPDGCRGTGAPTGTLSRPDARVDVTCSF